MNGWRMNMKRVLLVALLASTIGGYQVLANNVSPVITGLGGTDIVYQGKEPVRFAPDIVITDNDSSMIRAVTVRIVNKVPHADEIISVDTGATKIHQKFSDNTLVLDGQATPAEYTKVLQTLTYASKGENVRAANSEVEFDILVNDTQKIATGKQFVTYNAEGAAVSNVATDKSGVSKEEVADEAEAIEIPAEEKETLVAKKEETKETEVTNEEIAAEENISEGDQTPVDLVDMGAERIAAGEGVDLKDIGSTDLQYESVEIGEGDSQVQVGSMASEVAAQTQSLQSVMAKAYGYNKELAAERENVKVVTESVTETFSEWMPTITASAARGPQRIKQKGPNLSNNISGVADSQNLNLSLPLFDGLASVSRLKREKNNLEAAKARLAAIEQEVLLNTVISYMNIVREKHSLDLASDKEQALRKYYDGTQTRFDLGEITQTDVSQAYSRLTRAIADRVSAEGDYNSSKAVYERLVGEAPYGLYLDVEDPIIADVNTDVLVAEALENNPSIKVAEYNIKAAGFDVDSKRATIMPRLSLEAGQTWRSGGYLGSSSIDSTNEKELTFQVTVPIYQGGAEYSRIRKAQRTESKLEFDREEAENQLRASITQAVYDYQTALNTIDVYKANVRTARSALEGLEHEVQVGVRSTIDMLDAEQEVFEAEILLLRAKRDRIVDAYTVLEQLGRLTAEKLNLDVEYHNPDAYYDKVKYQFINY